ncbi:MAG: EamA family transporter [Oligosphaeraceae bacterium]|nr:EamA family transporter [Oligosphaeraceae bacterium]
MNRNQLKGLFLGLTATCFWSSFYPVSRYLFGSEAEKFDELFVSFLRFAFAFLFLLPFLFRGDSLRKFCRNWKHDWGLFLFLSAVGIVGEGVLIFVATKYTTAARASLMANLSPVFTVLLSWLAGKEMLTGRKVTGMLLGFAGITTVVLSRGADIFTGGASTLCGDFLALGSGVCWAVYTVFGTKITEQYGGIFCTAVLFGLGTVLMIPVMLLAGSKISFDFPGTVWLGLLYLGCCTNGLANGAWYCALKYVKPSELGALGYVSAMITVTFSIVFLAEKITWLFALAIVMVLGGVSLMLSIGNKRKSCQASADGC